MSGSGNLFSWPDFTMEFFWRWYNMAFGLGIGFWTISRALTLGVEWSRCLQRSTSICWEGSRASCWGPFQGKCCQEAWGWNNTSWGQCNHSLTTPLTRTNWRTISSPRWPIRRRWGRTFIKFQGHWTESRASLSRSREAPRMSSWTWGGDGEPILLLYQQVASDWSDRRISLDSHLGALSLVSWLLIQQSFTFGPNDLKDMSASARSVSFLSILISFQDLTSNLYVVTDALLPIHNSRQRQLSRSNSIEWLLSSKDPIHQQAMNYLIFVFALPVVCSHLLLQQKNILLHL